MVCAVRRIAALAGQGVHDEREDVAVGLAAEEHVQVRVPVELVEGVLAGRERLEPLPGAPLAVGQEAGVPGAGEQREAIASGAE